MLSVAKGQSLRYPSAGLQHISFCCLLTILHLHANCFLTLCLQCSMDQVNALTPLEDPQLKLPFVHETLSGLRSEVGDKATVLGFVGTPWTLAAYSVEGKADK